MGVTKLENWQKALNKWDEWNESISNARAHIKKKYSNLPELISLAHIDFKDADKGVSFQLNGAMVKV